MSGGGGRSCATLTLKIKVFEGLLAPVELYRQPTHSCKFKHLFKAILHLSLTVMNKVSSAASPSNDLKCLLTSQQLICHYQTRIKGTQSDLIIGFNIYKTANEFGTSSSKNFQPNRNSRWSAVQLKHFMRFKFYWQSCWRISCFKSSSQIKTSFHASWSTSLNKNVSHSNKERFLSAFIDS